MVDVATNGNSHRVVIVLNGNNDKPKLVAVGEHMGKGRVFWRGRAMPLLEHGTHRVTNGTRITGEYAGIQAERGETNRIFTLVQIVDPKQGKLVVAVPGVRDSRTENVLAYFQE